MVLIGKRRHYIVIEIGTKTSDNQGGYTVSWAALASERAAVNTLSMSRTLEAGGVAYKRVAEFNIRTVTTFTMSEDYRILWNSLYWTVHSIVPDPLLKEVTILAYA